MFHDLESTACIFLYTLYKSPIYTFNGYNILMYRAQFIYRLTEMPVWSVKAFIYLFIYYFMLCVLYIVTL